MKKEIDMVLISPVDSLLIDNSLPLGGCVFQYAKCLHAWQPCKKFMNPILMTVSFAALCYVITTWMLITDYNENVALYMKDNYFKFSEH